MRMISLNLKRLERIGVREDGGAAVEFALTLPILIVFLFAIINFGLTFGNFIQLTDGVHLAARAAASGRGNATPYTNIKTALTNGAPGLTAATLNSNLVVTVNGTACATDAACQTALTSAQTKSAVVKSTYPCSLNVILYNLAPSCTLTATTTEFIE